MSGMFRNFAYAVENKVECFDDTINKKKVPIIGRAPQRRWNMIKSTFISSLIGGECSVWNSKPHNTHWWANHKKQQQMCCAVISATKHWKRKDDKLRSIFIFIFKCSSLASEHKKKVNNHQFSPWNLCSDCCCCLFLSNETYEERKKMLIRREKGDYGREFLFEVRTHIWLSGRVKRLCIFLFLSSSAVPYQREEEKINVRW